MSVGRLFLLLIVVWCTIHAFRYLAKRKSVHLLPTNVNLARNYSRNTSLSLQAFHLQVSTTRWNARHDQFAAILKKQRYHKITSLLRGLYNIGIIFGAIGILAAMGLCAVTVWHGLNNMLSDHTPGSPVVRRAVESVINKRAPNLLASRRWPLLKPIIPGLTVPLGHLPVVLIAVFISQIVHEFGHAIAAAVESLPILTAGASFTICIPAAFVTFPASATNYLTSQARSRVTAAGPFHNLVFWCFILGLSRLGIAHVAAFVSGYKNLSSLGKVVVGVDANSPLYLHLSQGSIITHLDDVHLSSNDSTDRWASYLTGYRPPLSLGWCADTGAFGASQSCCITPSQSKESPLACFTSIDEVLNWGCINPVPLLTAQEKTTRCTTTSECSSESICVIPHQDTKLMRLKVHPSGSTYDYEKIILWSGSPDEVFEEVQVTDWLPRIWFLPLWLPPLVRSFWEYLSMATLSLYLFNLLPLPYLDGSKFLDNLLDSVFEDREDFFTYDLESLNREVQAQGRTGSRWKGTIMKIVHVTAVGSVITCILLALVNAWG